MQRSWSGVLPGEAFDLVAGSVMRLDLPAPYTARSGIYEVEQIHPGFDPVGLEGVAMRCPVSLRETSPSIYAWNPAADEQDVALEDFDPTVMQGVTDGGGDDGGIAHVAHPVGVWSDFVLVLKAGAKASALWVNGQLADTFTRHATIPQVVTAFLRHSAQPGAGGRIDRVLCLNRATAPGEVDLIRAWLRQGWVSDGAQGAAWVEPTITASAATLWSKPVPGHDAGGIWSKMGDTQFCPASTTKLLTAYIALNWLKRLDAMDTMFTRTASDASGGSASNLNIGDTLDLSNALANMGLPSGRAWEADIRRIGASHVQTKFVSTSVLDDTLLGISVDGHRL